MALDSDILLCVINRVSGETRMKIDMKKQKCFEQRVSLDQTGWSLMCWFYIFVTLQVYSA